MSTKQKDDILEITRQARDEKIHELADEKAKNREFSQQIHQLHLKLVELKSEKSLQRPETDRDDQTASLLRRLRARLDQFSEGVLFPAMSNLPER